MTTGKIDPSKIKDERCYCGHLKSEHWDRFSQGHGPCIKCDCPQFTWKEFVFKNT